MSRIDELIQEMCPDGVPYASLGTIANIGTGESDRKEASDHGKYPFYVRSKTILRKDTYEFDEKAIVIPGEGGIGEIFHYVSGKYALHQRAYRISFITAEVSPRFAYFYLYSRFRKHILSKAVDATVSSIRKPMIESFPVPVPPLAVQDEIVRILDTFTELEAELEAELDARRLQYHYLRREIFDLTSRKGVPWSTLGDVSSRVSSGGTPRVGIAEYYGGNIPWLRTQEVDFASIYSTGVHITEAGLQNSSANWIPKHSVIVAMYGATAGKVAINEIPLTTNQACCNLEIDPKKAHYRYVFFWIASQYGRLKAFGEGSQGNLNARKVRDFPIPLPTLSEQNRVASLLLQFDILVNDLGFGLPAEITARRQQYEYYRDKLLTFEELVA